MFHVSSNLMKRIVAAPWTGKVSVAPPPTPNVKDFDLKVYEHPNDDCVRYHDDIPLTERCAALKRLCIASLYFDAMNNSAELHESEQKALWVSFNEEVYETVLEDTMHLIKEHDGDIQQIYKEWTEKYGVPKCSISECTKTARHYGRGRGDEKAESMKKKEGAGTKHDALYDFYQSVHDRVHFFVAHLFDIGLRVDAPSSMTKKKGGNDNGLVDKMFAAERDLVNKKKLKSQLTPDRLNENKNKFTIQANFKNQGSTTLIDALLQKLIDDAVLQSGKLQQLMHYFEENACDSDCIEMDLEDLADSNISKVLESAEEALQRMVAFLQNMKLHRGTFSTGFIFKYPKWDKIQRKQSKNGKLAVNPSFKSLKEEIMETASLTSVEWLKFVDLKAEQYMKMKRVNKMKAKGLYLRENAPVTKEHIMAVICYCDFGAICTAFSATYRLLNVFEGIESMMRRHAKFANFGCLLVELVLDFGCEERGPFYCGLDCILNIGSFAIRLKGPCSTSTHREVAVNFAKSKGMILELNNDVLTAQFQSFFDCSWISAYWEESERLWIAGEREMRIVSITIVRTAKNYKRILHSLYVFDALISGVSLSGGQIKEDVSDFVMICNLIELELNGVIGGVDTVEEFDEYLKNEWELFLRKKTEIKLALWYIDEEFKNLSKLIVHGLKEYKVGEEISTGKCNVFKPDWISIFPNVHTISIWTSAYQGQYKFRFDALLESMKSLNVSVHIVNVYNGCFGQWIGEALSRPLTKDVSFAIDQSGWSFENERNALGHSTGVTFQRH